MSLIKHKLPLAVNIRNQFLKLKRHRKKFVTYKIKNKRWRPWPKWKRRFPKFFSKKEPLVRLGNFKYYENLYRYVDGIYSSFWVGKLTGSFIKKGKKHTIEKQILKLLISTKVQANYSGIELLLDSIERTKPILSVGSYVKSGKKLEYPVFLKPEKRRRIALQNIVKLIKNIQNQKLYQKIFEGLADLVTITEDGKYDLTSNRDDLFDLASVKGENLKQAMRQLRKK